MYSSKTIKVCATSENKTESLCYHKKARFPRQFAFQSVLAGHQYKVSNQRHHSIRNYLNAQEVIQDKGWKQAELHVNEIIGIHALQLGDKIKVRSGDRAFETCQKQYF